MDRRLAAILAADVAGYSRLIAADEVGTIQSLQGPLCRNSASGRRAPGGIAVSGRVVEDLAGKINVEWTDAGEHALKNIRRPVHVWCLGAAPRPSAQVFTLPDRPSIAVLPFDNLSGHPDETVFSDGITEDVITGLARFHSLFVVARNSSFMFRGKAVSVTEIGRQLGVSYILEGSVRRAGERMRITAQLVEAATGAHVWADSFDRTVQDVFAVQDDVTTRIVSTLFGRIEAASFQRSLRKPPDNLAAYDFLLRGIDRFRSYGDNDNAEACKLFEKAISSDPRYALAHAYLALARIALHGWGDTPQEVLDSQVARARHAVELEPQDGTCHRLLGLIYLFARQYDLAEHHARHAVSLNPKDADGTISFGFVLAQRGRAEEALAWMNKAARLNPLYPNWYNMLLAIGYFQNGQYDEAARAFRHIPHPGAWTRARLAACYSHAGRMDEALRETNAILRSQPTFSVDEFIRRAIVFERESDRSTLREGLLKAGLPL
jgi:TolB-like protein/tetratricopeptide (TPR) repeat protein